MENNPIDSTFADMTELPIVHPTKREVIFIDGAIADNAMLAAGARAGVDVVILDPSRDGLTQILETLQGKAAYDAIHIVSHGSPGALHLGSSIIDLNVLAERSADFSTLGTALSKDGDLLLYGCNVGTGEIGATWLQTVAALTGVDVAASDDLTGDSRRGGDWELERTVGDVQTASALTEETMQSFTATLAAVGGTLDFNTLNETDLGTIVTDGEGGASDIPNIQYQIYSANATGTPIGASWAYYTDVNVGTDGVSSTGNEATIVIRSADGTEFTFQGVKIADHFGSQPQVKIEGFRDGSSTGSVTLDISRTTFYNEFNTSHLPPSIFQNVDEVRITNPNDYIYAAVNYGKVNNLSLDKLVFGDSDITPPTISSVSATTANGTYKVGDVIQIHVTFDESIYVTASTALTLTLNSGGTATFSGTIMNSNTLIFNYTVGAGHSSADLDYSATTSLTLTGGTLTDAFGNNATLTLPAVGGPSSLGGQKAIVVDGVVPTISSVSVPTDGIYSTGQTLDFTVNFNDNVTVNTGGGTPYISLTLDTGGTVQAAYVSGSGTSALTFRYTIASGNVDVNGVALAGSITTNGGTIRDAAGNNATLTLNSVGATTGVLVDGVAPAVSSINRANASPTNASSVDYTVTFEESVTGVDTSDFTLTTSGTAAGTIASVTQVNGSTYTVTVNSISGDGSLRLDLKNSGTGITDTPGNAISGGYTSGQTYTVDMSAPAVTSVSVPSNGTYKAGDNLDFTVNFNESVTVNTTGGTPRIALTLDTGGTVYATYQSGSGSSALTFRYTVASGNLDTDGITVGALDANGGTLKDSAGNDATLTLNSVGSTASVLVDAIVPVVASVNVPADATYIAGQTLDFTVNFSENVTVNTGGGTPYISLTLDTGGTVQAAYLSGSGSNALTFRYTIANGNVDTNGITLASAITANGGTLRDATGNDATLTLNSVGATDGVLVDGVAPSVTSINRTNTSPTNASSVDYTVTFAENVSGVDTSDFTLTTTSGTASGTIASVTQVSGSVYTVTVNGISGDGQLRLDLNGNGTGITDTPGNAIGGGYTSGQTYVVDTTAPSINSVGVPANGTYKAGDNLDFTVNFSENVAVDTSGGTPRIAVTLNTGGTKYATYVSGSGTSALVFRYTIEADTLDADGISVGGTIDANGGSLRDSAGNDASPTLNSVGSTASVLVDAIAPTVASVNVPTDATYVAGQTLDFVVNFSENITVNTGGGTPYISLTLDTGGTVQAAYLSGSGTSSLAFRYTVASGNVDTNGIMLGGAITANGGTLRDAAGNNATLTLNSVGATTGVLVDAVAPSITSVQVPPNNVYKAGNNLDFLVQFSENVVVTGTPRIALTLDTGGTVYATYEAGSGTNTLTFRYTVDAGHVDANGISVGALALNGGTIADAATNNAALTLNSVGATTGVKVDAVVPVLNTATFTIAENSANGTVVDTASGTDATALTYALTDDAGGRFTINAGTGQVTVANGSLLDFETANSHQIKVKATDEAGNETETAFTVNVTNVAEAPVVANLGGDAANYVKASAAIIIDQAAAATLVDPDTSVLNGGTLTVSVVSNADTAEDVLAIRDQGAGAGNITIAAGDVSYGGTVIGSYTGGSNGNALEVTFNNNASLVAVQALLRNITYWNSDAVDPTGSTRTVRFVVTDGGGGTSVNYDTTVTVGTNILPVLATNSGTQLDLSTSKVITSAMLNATDGDHTAAQLTYTVKAVPTKGSLTLNNVALSVNDTFTQDDVNAGKLSYTSTGTAGADSFAFTVADAAGGGIAQTSFNLTVNAPPAPSGPSTPPPSSTTIDGVVVNKQTTTNSDGSASQTVTIPVVAPGRVEETGDVTKADIPLVTSSGNTVLLAQVPTGFGLQVSGSAAPKPAGNSLTDLIREIQLRTPSGSSDQAALTGGGSGFLDSLANDTPLLVQTIVPTTANNTSAPNAPLVISGSSATTGAPYTALVIDTRSLPSGTTIQLQNVEFAAVIGTVNVTGGAGSQNVWGDSASQTIILGADDDILHGGDGDDIVGSGGGNDQIFGDGGNDIVFGGEGNDTIDGGTGRDILQLSGSGRADYAIRVENGKIVMTHRNNGIDGSDSVANVEAMRFTGTQPDLSASGTITRLYDVLFDRAPDQHGMMHWTGKSAGGLSMHDIAAAFLGSDEAKPIYSALNNAQYVDKLYNMAFGRQATAGERSHWNELLDTGKADRADVLLSIADSTEKLALDASVPAELDFNRSDVAMLVRLYDSLFGRRPDLDGINAWIRVSEAGTSMRDIASGFIDSWEAQQLYGAMSHAQFVDSLYKVALDRNGKAEEISWWAARLDAGQVNRADVLLGFSESVEKIGLVGVISTSIDLA